MNRITIQIETENAAFCDSETGEKNNDFCVSELERIFRKIIVQLRDQNDTSRIYDINGNSVGHVTIE